MPLGLRGRPPRERSLAVIRHAVERGLRLIDTADVYCLDDGELGYGERLVAQALPGSVRGDVIIATKGGMTRRGERWGRDGRPEHLRRACEASLRALETDCIPLYQLHVPDPRVPWSESVGALARLREEGKIAAVGLCNVTVPQIREARRIVPIASVQNQMNPWGVSIRPSPVIGYCRRQGILFLAHSPLGGPDRVAAVRACAPLAELAAEAGYSAEELVLAWLMGLSDNLVPIPGARSEARVDSAIRALDAVPDRALLRAVERSFRALPGVQGPLAQVLAGLGRRLGRLAGRGA